MNSFLVTCVNCRRQGVLKLIKQATQPVTAFVHQGVINDIYAFEPPAPSEFFRFAVVVEAIVASLFMLVTLAPVDNSGRAEMFRVLGGASVVSVHTMSIMAALCVVVGGLTIALGGIARYWLTQPCN